ncbi:hypothetical protein E4H12_06905 [Candidatus Thorarchaeota archaeon]|nr:MAG: hypothetical protein E4H12_06905 [Candidatus Thorarchaeota archaeon]
MSNVNGHHSLLEELEKAESVLEGLLRKISNVNEYLNPLEHMLRAEDFSSTGSYIAGVSNGIVCVLSAMIKGDPLATSIELIKGKGRIIPAIIKGSDRSETKSTCDSILKIVEGKPGGIPITYVINLRWANLQSVIDGENVLVVGKRFSYGEKVSLNKLYNRFKEIGITILEDQGEFGGGPLTFRLTQLARKLQNMTILEVTLSRHFAEDYERVAEILESFTIL